MANNSEKDIQELRNDIAKLKADFGEVAKTLRHITNEQVSRGREKVRESAERSRDRARETLDSFEHEIEDRPLTSIATAFGVGFILGKLLDR
jgi:ElaB/YqjD/DUF883 family membrane-anchored ribosome-binding protein